MYPALATLSSPCLAFLPLKSLSSSASSASFLGFPSPKPLRLWACSAKPDSVPVSETNSWNRPLAQKLQSFAKTAVLVGATALMVGKFSNFPAKAEPAPAMVEREPAFREEKEEAEKTQDAKQKQTSPLSEFLESNEDAIEALGSLLYQNLENHEDEEALSILNRLVSAQPEVTDWKFLLARLLGEMGQKENARKVFEEILQSNPFSFEALFENALLMDRCGEGEAVLKRLEEALALAQEEKKAKEARDVVPPPVWPSDRSEEEISVSHRTTSGDSPRSHGVDGWRWSFWSLRSGRGSGGGGESSSGGRVALGYHTLGFPSGAIWTMSSSHYELSAGDDADPFLSVIESFKRIIEQVLLIMNFFFLLQMTSSSHYELYLAILIHPMMNSKRLNKFFSL
ncbi:protein SLOW GREEN 1 [Hibiscus syriacus]|uniref:Protein SLOW GREEN 1 n=1 Tax=Hibiscus syriacus TaxID=106335 RepID=A0A6A2WCF7_HIBSY|nr:protein SLOW GREEN 1 [Hibiscus syriacus]